MGWFSGQEEDIHFSTPHEATAPAPDRVPSSAGRNQGTRGEDAEADDYGFNTRIGQLKLQQEKYAAEARTHSRKKSELVAGFLGLVIFFGLGVAAFSFISGSITPATPAETGTPASSVSATSTPSLTEEAQQVATATVLVRGYKDGDPARPALRLRVVTPAGKPIDFTTESVTQGDWDSVAVGDVIANPEYVAP